MYMEKKEIQKVFGENVKVIRRSKNFSQEELAEKIEKSTNFVSLLELGKTGVAIDTLVRLCNVLETSPNNLFSNLCSYEADSQDQYILDNISAFNETDKNMVIDLVDYIRESKK